MSRWKEGIEGITPLQQVKGQLNATYIMLFERPVLRANIATGL